MNWLMKGWFVALAVAAGSTAQAGMLFDATFKGVNPSESGNFTYYARSNTSATSSAGRMNWLGSNSPNLLPPNFAAFRNLNGQGTGNDKFITFCIEVTQNVANDAKYQIETKQLKDLPTSGSPSPMQAAKANDVAQFWGKWKTQIAGLQANTGITADSITYSAAELASALQLAIWEIVYEATGTGYDVKNEAGGNGSGQGFRVTGEPAAGNSSRTLANYLLNNTDFENGGLANVVGLKVGSMNQDQVTIIGDGWVIKPDGLIEAVPVPPAVVLVAAGIASGLFLRRRLAGQSAAAVA